MAGKLYSQEELSALRNAAKRVTNPNARWSEKPADMPVHRQRVFQARAEAEGGHYEIYQRENIRDPLDYSCGIVYLPLDGTRLTLARYNGSGHEHGDIEFRPHIHSATPEAIAAGVRPEREAQATERYATSEGALACLLRDFRVGGIKANPDQRRLVP